MMRAFTVARNSASLPRVSRIGDGHPMTWLRAGSNHPMRLDLHGKNGRRPGAHHELPVSSHYLGKARKNLPD
jgi:hypothetical protein